MRRAEIVLIDDDEYVRDHWERRFTRSSRRIRTFRSACEFRASSKAIPVNALIFVDQNLGGEEPGTEVLRRLFDRGYKDLYLCTAHPPGSLQGARWIKGVVGKLPPAWLLDDDVTAPLTASERGGFLRRMSADDLKIYQQRMENFLNIAHGQDSGSFAGVSLDGFGIPDLVMNAWERAITLGLSDERIKERVDHAWRVANMG